MPLLPLSLLLPLYRFLTFETLAALDGAAEAAFLFWWRKMLAEHNAVAALARAAASGAVSNEDEVRRLWQITQFDCSDQGVMPCACGVEAVCMACTEACLHCDGK